MEKYEINTNYANKLCEIKKGFTVFLKNLINTSNKKEIRIVGIGNNITAGIDYGNNLFVPQLNQIASWIQDECIKKNIDVSFFNFPLYNLTKNQELISFIYSNPTSAICRDLALKKINPKFYNPTLFKEMKSFSSNDQLSLEEVYNEDTVIITNLNCCNGMINIPKFYTQKKHVDIIEWELVYLQCIINYIINLSSDSYICVNNLPYDIKGNYNFDEYNKEIKNIALYNPKTWFNDNNYALFYKENKFANLNFYQPFNCQYHSLYSFIGSMIKEIPSLMSKNEQNLQTDLTQEYNKTMSIKLSI